MTCYKFPTESNSERILKIGQYLVKLWARVWCLVFLTHGVVLCHRHPFNGPQSRTTQVSRYQNGKTTLDFTEARDSMWQWHQLGHMQVCTLLQTDNHASTPPLTFLQAGCPSCRPTNSVKALKALLIKHQCTANAIKIQLQKGNTGEVKLKISQQVYVY